MSEGLPLLYIPVFILLKMNYRLLMTFWVFVQIFSYINILV